MQNLGNYALWNAGTAGAGLAVENGGTTLTTTAAALSGARSVIGTVFQTKFASDAEMLIWGTGALTGKVAVGLATDAHSSAAAMGATAESIAYLPAEGKIRSNGVDLATVATSGPGVIVRIAFAPSDPLAPIAFYADEALLGSFAMPAGMVGDPVTVGASLGSDADAGDIQVELNAWVRGFESGGLTSRGWWVPYELSEAPRISTVPYLTHADDDFPSTRFEDGIQPDNPGLSRGFHVWFWGLESPVQGARFRVTYSDPDGLLDPLLSLAWRDQPATVQWVDHRDPLSAVISTATFYIEDVQVENDLVKVVTLCDIIALLDAPLQSRKFRPDVDPQSANRVMPTLIGVSASIPVFLSDAGEDSSPPAPVFQVSGQDVEQIGKVRTAGVQLPLGTGYEPLAGAQQIQLFNTPPGEITLDASRTGTSYIPPVPDDAIDGTGNPFVEDVTPGEFVDWTAHPDPTAIPDTTPHYVAPGRAGFPQNANSPQSWMVHDTDQLIEGERYLVKFKIYALQQIDTGLEAEIGLSYNNSRFLSYAKIDSSDFWTGNPAGDPVEYETTFVCLVTHFPNIYYSGNQVTGGGTTAVIGDLEFIKLPPLNDIGDDIAVEDALPCLKLEDAMRMIIETHGGFPSTVWAAEDAAEIDAATGSAGGGYYFPEQTTLREAIEKFLPGYNAGIFTGRDGRLRVKKIEIPEIAILGITDPIILDTKDFLGDLRFVPDKAPGMSRQMGVRKNHVRLRDADVDTTVLSLSQRARLKRDYRNVVSTRGQFAQGYAHADANDPIETALWFAADGQRTINEAGDAYEIGRGFYIGRMAFRDDIDIGTVLLLRYHKYGMDVGIPVFAIPEFEDQAVAQEFTRIVFWGAAPPEFS